jgi:Ca2+-binding RTX toxin-like protein
VLRARRFRRTGIALLCAQALFPAGAFAATASIETGRVFYLAGPGEVNNLTISLFGDSYSLSDPGATITAGPGCTTSQAMAACPTANIRGITARVDDGADSVENTTLTPSLLTGGDGNDTLTGGPGNDTLRGEKGVDTHSGGDGDDLIDSRGDRPDVVTCGIGNDTVMADAVDSVAPDCETIDRGGAPPPPPPGPTAGPPPSAESLLGPTETRRLDLGACVMETLGTPGNDRLAGTALGDSLFGLQGNDLLTGVRRDDCLFGGAGSDRLSGGADDDRLLGDDSRTGVGGNDRLYGDAGEDLLLGGPGRDRLGGGRGNDRLTGGRGRNHLRGGSGNDRLNAVNGTGDRLHCGRGRDRARADREDRVRGCERVRWRRSR